MSTHSRPGIALKTDVSRLFISVVLGVSFGCSNDSDTNSGNNVVDRSDTGQIDTSDANPNNSNNANNVNNAPDGSMANNVEMDAAADSASDFGDTQDVGENGYFFNDNFDTPQDFLAGPANGWTVLNENVAVEISTEAQTLTMIPNPVARNAWFEQFQSPLLHQSVSGDFIAETSAQPFEQVGNNTPVVGFNAAGFVIRDPASAPGMENWVMFNVGAQRDSTPFGVEVKTTVDSSSALELFDVTPGAFELRVCRTGGQFTYFYRSAGDAWTEVQPQNDHNRTDFPSELQVGLMAGTWSGDGVRGEFGFARAWRPAQSCLEPAP